MLCKETFAARLECMRKRKNISLAKLAKEIGVTRASLNRYEIANRTPNIEVLYKLAQYFNVSSDYLIGLTDCKDPKKCKDTGVCSRLANQLKNITLVAIDKDGDITGGRTSLADLLPSSFFEVD